jgi:molybdate transport system substrate-binding protein
LRVKFPLVLLLTALLGVPTYADPLRVSAAANLQKVFTEALIPAFTKKTGVAVLATYGATKLLATQIENGAPIDVFVAADTVTPQKLASEKLLIASTVQPYAIGQLVVWSRKEAAHHPSRLEDLASSDYAKIAFANPNTAPYGLAAQEAFAKTGLTAAVAPKLVQAENIGQALQFAQSGNADAALTALSLVIEDKADPYFVVPETLHDPITQSLGLVSTTTQTTQALEFIDYLTGKDAAKLWKRYGYTLPKTPAQSRTKKH